MAIKKINREELKNVVAGRVIKPIEPVVEEEVLETEELINEDETLENEVFEDENETIEDYEKEDEIEEVEEEITKTPKSEKITIKIDPKKSTVKETKKNNSEEKKSEKKSPLFKKDKNINTVFPKSQLIKMIKQEIAENIGDISLVDTETIFKIVESCIYEACQKASVRFLNGIIKTETKRAIVSKAPNADYQSYTCARKVITLKNSEIGFAERYKGYVEGDKFIVTGILNSETKKYDDAEGEIKIEK